MNPTLFVEFVKKWFAALTEEIVEKMNDGKSPVTYLYKTMLRPELSPDLKWEALSVNTSIVAADVVAMDSSLPLKKRDAVSRAGGTIPKLGMKMQKSEKLLTDIQVMQARGVKEKQVALKIFEDVPRCIRGIYERPVTSGRAVDFEEDRIDAPAKKGFVAKLKDRPARQARRQGGSQKAGRRGVILRVLRVGAVAARRVHTPEVARSNRAPATGTIVLKYGNG